MFVTKYFRKEEEVPADGGAGGGAATPPATPPADNEGATPWHGMTDPADVAFIANKGWSSPADVVKSYQGAEKLIGKNPSDLITIPRADDTDGFRAAMARLGMPAEAKDYKIEVPEGIDPAYSDWARGKFHELGLTASQAEGLAKANNEYIAGLTKQAQQDYANNVAADKMALLKEWGAGHERMLNTAKAAASALEFTPEVVDAIEKQIGYGETMKLFAKLGQKMSEDGFVGADAGGQKGFGDMVTPDEARAQWEEAKLDANFVKALGDPSHPGHKSAQDKQSKLFKLMYPEG